MSNKEEENDNLYSSINHITQSKTCEDNLNLSQLTNQSFSWIS